MSLHKGFPIKNSVNRCERLKPKFVMILQNIWKISKEIPNVLTKAI